MAEFTHEDLKAARKAHGMTQWQLANAIHVSEDKIKRWEGGDQKPSPDEVSDVEHVLRAEKELLWHRWMLSNVESYRERYMESQQHPLLNAIVNVKHELQDVLSLQTMAELDALDGRFDDEVLKASLVKELKEAQASITQLLGQLGNRSQ